MIMATSIYLIINYMKKKSFSLDIIFNSINAETWKNFQEDFFLF